MADALRDVFEARKAEGAKAFVTFVTAGFPTREATIPIMHAMQAGGADVIELGVPFSDPIGDGPTIQGSNTVALANGVEYTDCLEYVRTARKEGVTIPIVLMGYYNPLLAHGEEKAVKDAREAGANGFIVVDLPPEEAVHFRDKCSQEDISYVPLIAPSTSPSRIKSLTAIADSFIYVVSKMGTTGSSAEVKINESLPELIKRIKECTTVPLAVGFGISTREQFEYVSKTGAEGGVVGSRIVNVIEQSGKDPKSIAAGVQKYCSEISGRSTALPNKNARSSSSASVPRLPKSLPPTTVSPLPARFGEFGGQYVPESLVDCLTELEAAHNSAREDPAFWKEFESHYGYMNRPSRLYLAERLTEQAGGAKIWLKREDLNHTGSHKINNAIGQILLAKRIGKTRIIAETGAGQHGVATATVCAKFGMPCTIYMGAEDVRRQALNVFRIRMLGAKVVPVESGSRTLKDAINDAMRDWVANVHDTHYLVGSAIGPHPFPTLVRDFQRVIGREIKQTMMETVGKLPEAVVACVGGGSNAIGTFYDFIEDKNVRLIGVEAGGDGVDTDRHSATLALGRPGVLHGVRTYLLQSPTGQIIETHSVSAGLDYPGVGPEHAWLKDSNRAEYIVATDEDALRGFRMCTQLEGIIPALESAHAIWGGIQIAKTLPKEANVVICLSGRGDKDVEQISELLPGKWADVLDWHVQVAGTLVQAPTDHMMLTLDRYSMIMNPLKSRTKSPNFLLKASTGVTRHARRHPVRFASTASESGEAATSGKPMPAGGELPGVGTSKLMRKTRENALRTPGIVWTEEEAESNSPDGGRETTQKNMYQSVRDALSIALSKDDSAVVFGEDVAFGGVFRCTMGLAQEFGKERVFNTPLTEQGIAGFGAGLAAMGQTAIGEIQFSDYIFPAFDQIVNEIAKIRYRSGGQFNVGGLTLRTPSMAVGHGGLYHSQSPEGFFLAASGLKVVVPRSPIQAKGLLLASIRDPNPVIFMEPKVLYRSAVEQVPVSDYTLPLSKIDTLISGSDLTLLSYGTPLYTCETALQMLTAPPPSLDVESIIPKDVRKAKIELIDLRTILPWDMEGVIESVNRTGRLVIVHEAGKIGGVGAEIAAEVQKRCFLRLEAPVKLVCGWDVPVALQFEKFHIPDAIRVVDALVETLRF